MAKVLERVMRPLDERLDLTNRIETRVLSRPVPVHARRFWYCFGGLTFFTAIIQGLSGLYLALYYEPTPDGAYASVFNISHNVAYGWLVRPAHAWGSELMVAFILVHMMRVYATASYKHPREFNWVAGVGLFAITMSFAVTGYLLPWTQRAYWGTTALVNVVRELPFVGHPIASVLAGGDAVGASTLSRFYATHLMLLPVALVGLLIVHFWMIRKQGISGPL